MNQVVLAETSPEGQPRNTIIDILTSQKSMHRQQTLSDPAPSDDKKSHLRDAGGTVSLEKINQQIAAESHNLNFYDELGNVNNDGKTIQHNQPTE